MSHNFNQRYYRRMKYLCDRHDPYVRRVITGTCLKVGVFIPRNFALAYLSRSIWLRINENSGRGHIFLLIIFSFFGLIN